MKIIDIGICIDNIDPKGIGRIRCVRYNDYVGEKEKAQFYTSWSDTDPFVAIPFLPNNINMIPEIGQSVKVINYNTVKETVNQEYIPGPFTSMYDYNSQQFSQQIEDTSYGVAVKSRPNIRSSTGEYIRQSENVFAKETDYGIYGKYGSDLLFTENGLQLRGGKLKTKDSVTPQERLKMIVVPFYTSNKISKLSLKKYPKRGVIKTREEKNTTSTDAVLKTIIEYEINTLSSNNVTIDFYVYNVINSLGSTYKTSFFNQNVLLVESALKLINNSNNTTSPTHSITTDSLNNVPIIIRDIIYNIGQNSLSYLNANYSNEDVHPFYFRPTKEFITMSGTSTEISKKTEILNKIIVNKVGPNNGLIWSKDESKQKTNTTTRIVEYLDIENNSPEQTFASLISDKIYLLSTEPNETQKKVIFENLDKYEITQENYLLNIDKNTYSSVRGDNLIRFLYKLIDVLFKHQHNVVGPYVKNGFIEHEELLELIKNLENDILNKSIKIN